MTDEPYVYVATKRLEMPSDRQWWVEIRTRVTEDDSDAAAMVAIRAQAVQSPIDRRKKYTELAREVVLRFITDWNLTDAAGKELPLKAASFGGVDARDMKFLRGEVLGAIAEATGDPSPPLSKRSGSSRKARASKSPPAIPSPSST